MNATVIAAILMVGSSVGMRTFTAAAVIAWAAHLGCINLDSTGLSFMSSAIAVGFVTLAALFEYVVDVLPMTPARTTAPQLSGRFVLGTFSAACLLAAAGVGLLFCVIGGLAAIGSAFAGYYLRTGIVRSLGTRDAFVAVTEDLVSIGLALAAIWMIR